MNEDAVERVVKAIREAELRIMPQHDESPSAYSHRYWRSHAAAAITEYNAYLRERAQDSDVIEAAARELNSMRPYEVTDEAGYALTAALDVMLGKEQYPKVSVAVHNLDTGAIWHVGKEADDAN